MTKLTECEKMVKFVEENYPLHYVIWEQQFFIDNEGKIRRGELPTECEKILHYVIWEQQFSIDKKDIIDIE